MLLFYDLAATALILNVYPKTCTLESKQFFELHIFHVYILCVIKYGNEVEAVVAFETCRVHYCYCL